MGTLLYTCYQLQSWLLQIGPLAQKADMSGLKKRIYDGLGGVAEITTPLFLVSLFLFALAIIFKVANSEWAQQNKGWLFPAVAAVLAISALPEIGKWLVAVAPCPTLPGCRRSRMDTYRCLIHFLDRRDEQVFLGLTLDKVLLGIVLLGGILFFTAELNLLWRAGALGAGAILVNLLCTRIGSMPRYERLLLAGRGLCDQAISGQRLTPDQLPGTQTTATDFLIIQRGGPVRVRRSGHGGNPVPTPPAAPVNGKEPMDAHP
jgi:hypothetical protein